MTETWRLFIAIELPPSVLAQLGAIQIYLQQQAPPRTVRWVDSKGIHLTLKFLGEVPTSQREALEHALEKAAQVVPAFDLAAGGLGCFPNAKRPRVVWVGIHGEHTLTELHNRVEAHVAPLGYPTEARPFTPHLTLGRIRQDAPRDAAEKLGAFVTSSAHTDRYPWQVSTVSLMRSELKPIGAVYTEVCRAALRRPQAT